MVERVYVIHSPHISPERKSIVLERLRSIGVSDPEVVASSLIEDFDPRLINNSLSKGEISLIDTNIRCLNHALKSNVEIFAIVEDDIKIRKDFNSVWRRLGRQLRDTPWGIATPYRWPSGGDAIVKESCLDKPSLVNIHDQTNTQFLIIKKACIADLIESYENCIKQGWPLDFFYGYFSRKFDHGIVTINKNVVGQDRKMRSTLQPIGERRNTRWRTYRSSYTFIDFAVVNAIYKFNKLIKRYVNDNFNYE